MTETASGMTETDSFALDSLHPAVRTWFERRFGAPTDAQVASWPVIGAGRDVLLAAGANLVQRGQFVDQLARPQHLDVQRLDA